MTSSPPEPVGVVQDVVRTVKPKLRGWLHAGTFPLSVAAGIVLVALSGGTAETLANASFAISAALLFGTSALYHRGTWSPNVERQLKRFDHSNIFLIIAGTYTPFAVILLGDHGGDTLLWIVWAAALGGIAFRILWVGAPRWLYTPIYLALGWVSVFYIGDIYRTGGAAVVTLIAVGGLLYSVGAVVYARKRPDPYPTVFGYHEIFHVLVVAAAALHFAVIAFYVLPLAG
jgi:hemolysin III